MITRICFFSLFLFIGIIYGQQENIAVLDLDPTGISQTDEQFLSDRLRTELFETGSFQVVERQKMNSILKEPGFQNVGCTSVECAVEIGQLLNVQKMVAGSIGKIEDIYSISLRLINVQTGAIMKTAIRDYKGKLSSVLTEVIPAVAKDLSSTSILSENIRPELKNVESQNPYAKESFSHKGFALFLKGGFVSLGYPDNLLSVQDELKNLTGFRADDISQHSYFGVELVYALSERWSIKAGVGQMNALSAWIPSLDGYDLVNEGIINVHGDFERYHIFINTYLGFNYNLWRIGERSAMYFGVDVGSLGLRSGINEIYIFTDGNRRKNDKEYNYSVFALKVTTGFNYQLSTKFSVAAELAIQSAGPFDTSDQQLTDLFPEELRRLIFPEEIAASGIQLNLMFGYYF
jgi:hypothetical protein